MPDDPPSVRERRAHLVLLDESPQPRSPMRPLGDAGGAGDPAIRNQEAFVERAGFVGGPHRQT
jgi:hypothetical protein